MRAQRPGGGFDRIRNETGAVGPRRVAKISEAMKRRGVKGDALLDAQDRAQELLDHGATIDDDGMVTLFHRTTPENADAIIKSGHMTAKEDGLFFGTHRGGQIEGYGEGVIRTRLPLEKVELNDVFGNEAHVRVPLRRAGEKFPIKAEKGATPLKMLGLTGAASGGALTAALLHQGKRKP